MTQTAKTDKKKMLNLILNGQAIQAEAGNTVLEVAKLAGADIPTLCHHPALDNIGACRMCIVEIKGERALQPSCTFPIYEGMEIQTESPKVVELRRYILEMLFSERNHFCMFCEMSGDCELQSLAYRYKLDHWTYPMLHPKLGVDGTRKYFMMDHNRCILCRRCIRACSDLVANHTLGVKSRGAKTMISADLDSPFGLSSCISCGTCLQVCPTGALVDRKSVYMGRNVQVQRTKSYCASCSVGCRIEVITRAGKVLRVEGDWSGPNAGVLCIHGKFDPFFETRKRVTTPMRREGQEWKSISWEDAMDEVAKQLKASGKDKMMAWTTGKAFDETMNQFIELFKKKLGGFVGTFESALSELNLPFNGGLEHLDNADTILVVGVDPLAKHKVLGYRIRKARDRGARIILVGGGSDAKTGFSKYAHIRMEPSKLEDAIAICEKCEHPVVVYGEGVGRTMSVKLAQLDGKAAFIPLFPATNGYHAKQLSLPEGVKMDRAKVVYLYLQDIDLTDETIKTLRKSDYMIVHASYFNPVTQVADLVLPAPIWFERAGTFKNLEGREVKIEQVIPPPEGIRHVVDVMQGISERL